MNLFIEKRLYENSNWYPSEFTPFQWCLDKYSWINTAKYLCQYTGILMNNYTQRNLFEILLNQTKIRLYLPFSNWFGTKRTAVWFKINRKIVNTIWFWFDLVRFRKGFSVCTAVRRSTDQRACAFRHHAECPIWKLFLQHIGSNISSRGTSIGPPLRRKGLAFSTNIYKKKV